MNVRAGKIREEEKSGKYGGNITALVLCSLDFVSKAILSTLVSGLEKSVTCSTLPLLGILPRLVALVIRAGSETKSLTLMNRVPKK